MSEVSTIATADTCPVWCKGGHAGIADHRSEMVSIPHGLDDPADPEVSVGLLYEPDLEDESADPTASERLAILGLAVEGICSQADAPARAVRPPDRPLSPEAFAPMTSALGVTLEEIAADAGVDLKRATRADGFQLTSAMVARMAGATA